ncbi:hypothetical protein ACIQV3_06355 [Streptomyces sp. NPDC099050]|uniref:hypothetical protein n=1 Tax=Streptomyces sp. NPDC099050 TaxID=3366100 RepID=UPI0038192D1C
MSRTCLVPVVFDAGDLGEGSGGDSLNDFPAGPDAPHVSDMTDVSEVSVGRPA